MSLQLLKTGTKSPDSCIVTRQIWNTNIRCEFI